MQRDEELNEIEADGDDRNRSNIERIRSQQTYKRAVKPQRRSNSSLSFNGIHRRRKKRVNW